MRRSWLTNILLFGNYLVYGWFDIVHTVHICSLFKVNSIKYTHILSHLSTDLMMHSISIPLFSRSIFAGLLTALYYFCIHNDATRVHSNPAARENFAFPFIISQIYFLAVWIEEHNQQSERISAQNSTSGRQDRDDRSNHFKIGFFTAFAILAWDFSTYIFATQIIIILIMVRTRFIKRRYLFLQNFILAHIMARLLANNVVRQGWTEFNQIEKPMNFDCSALITLLLYIVQKYPTKRQRLRTIEKIILRLFLLLMAFTTISELISDQIFQSHYVDILLTKLYLKEPTFSALLNICRKDFQFIDFATLKAYNCLFVSKVLVIFMLTWAVAWLKRSREREENSFDRIQRSKNYLLEDYLEEKKLTMSELVRIEDNKELQQCMALLKLVKYDYDLYKIERRKKLEREARTNPLSERDAFLNEVRRYKEEIYEKEQLSDGNNLHPLEDNSFSENILQENTFEDNTNEEDEKIHKEDPNAEDNELLQNINESPDDVHDWQQFLTIERPMYFYILLQTAAFAIMTLLMYKMKYVLTPFLCIIASTFPPKSLIPRNYNLKLIYVIVVGSCMFDRGMQNIREQYSFIDGNDLKDSQEHVDLREMLKWIKSNTDKTDVFAGPEDIIGLVLLATGRPIANNPLSSSAQMK